MNGHWTLVVTTNKENDLFDDEVVSMSFLAKKFCVHETSRERERQECTHSMAVNFSAIKVEWHGMKRVGMSYWTTPGQSTGEESVVKCTVTRTKF